MPRAFIVLARNDLDNNLLQVLDLKPNSTLSQGSAIYQPHGQTEYVTNFVQTDEPATTAGGGGERTMDEDAYGLAAYLLDVVENVGGGNISLSDAECVEIMELILADVAAGNPVTLAAINAAINTPAGVAGSDLDGAGSASFGTVEEVLRILSGEVYKVPEGEQVANAANAFPGDAQGFFATRPNVESAYSVRSPGDRPVRGRSFKQPIIQAPAPAQTEPEDTEFRDHRVIMDTGDLHRSAFNGALSELADATFEFLNPSFTYGAGGTALDIEGNALDEDGIARAVVVYDAEGNVI